MRPIVLAVLTGAFAAPLWAEVPKVVTDVTPVSALVAMVMGDLGQPQQLLDKGADPHDFALRPSQMTSIAAADLVVWIGPELTPGLERAMAGSGTQLALLAALGQETRSFADSEGHDHGGIDPHAWLDPDNADHWLGLIAAELSQIDPEHAETYAANAAAGVQALDRMEAELAALLAPVKQHSFVTFHDAFGYFTGHFGLADAGALATGDAAAPGAARVAGLRDQIAQSQIACVFPEAGHDPALLTQIIDGTGARLGQPLDPEGLMLDPGPGAYEALMRGLAAALVDCLAP